MATAYKAVSDAYEGAFLGVVGLRPPVISELALDYTVGNDVEVDLELESSVKTGAYNTAIGAAAYEFGD